LLALQSFELLIYIHTSLADVLRHTQSVPHIEGLKSGTPYLYNRESQRELYK
jgi:hypothetical protein